jgi:hypothetical protein
MVNKMASFLSKFARGAAGAGAKLFADQNRENMRADLMSKRDAVLHQNRMSVETSRQQFQSEQNILRTKEREEEVSGRQQFQAEESLKQRSSVQSESEKRRALDRSKLTLQGYLRLEDKAIKLAGQREKAQANEELLTPAQVTNKLKQIDKQIDGYGEKMNRMLSNNSELQKLVGLTEDLDLTAAPEAIPEIEETISQAEIKKEPPEPTRTPEEFFSDVNLTSEQRRQMTPELWRKRLETVNIVRTKEQEEENIQTQRAQEELKTIYPTLNEKDKKQWRLDNLRYLTSEERRESTKILKESLRQ